MKVILNCLVKRVGCTPRKSGKQWYYLQRQSCLPLEWSIQASVMKRTNSSCKSSLRPSTRMLTGTEILLVHIFCAVQTVKTVLLREQGEKLNQLTTYFIGLITTYYNHFSSVYSLHFSLSALH